MRFPERHESRRPIVINQTGRHGSEQAGMASGLGELGRPNRVLVTPDRPRATPIRCTEPERSPAVTIAWLRPMRALQNAVHCATIGHI
jgi:hypothetical protein